MSKKLLILIPLLVIASIAIVACGQGGSAFECDDELGCVTYAPDEPIRIASALVISGANAQLGLDSQYGVEIAMDMRGQVAGHDVELQAEDDGCTAAPVLASPWPRSSLMLGMPWYPHPTPPLC